MVSAGFALFLFGLSLAAAQAQPPAPAPPRPTPSPAEISATLLGMFNNPRLKPDAVVLSYGLRVHRPKFRGAKEASDFRVTEYPNFTASAPTPCQLHLQSRDADGQPGSALQLDLTRAESTQQG